MRVKKDQNLAIIISGMEYFKKMKQKDRIDINYVKVGEKYENEL